MQLIKSQNDELEDNLKTIQKQNDELQLANKLKDEFSNHHTNWEHHCMVWLVLLEALISSGANGPIPANQKYQLDIIINSGQRLATLVDDSFDYHKMRYGSLTLRNLRLICLLPPAWCLSYSSPVGHKPIRIINQVPSDLG